MALYPIFLETKNRPVLVIGGGNVGAEKVRGLLNGEADITLVSPALIPELQEHKAAGRIKHVERSLFVLNRQIVGIHFFRALCRQDGVCDCFGAPARRDACATVIEQTSPFASTSSMTSASRSRVPATATSRNSMSNVSVSAK